MSNISHPSLPLIFGIFCLLTASITLAEGDTQPATSSPQEKTLGTLSDLANMLTRLSGEISEREQQLQASQSASEKSKLKTELEQLEKEQRLTRRNFEKIATSADVPAGAEAEAQAFDIQSEMLSLLEPIIKEVKHMTSDVRKKTELRDQINYVTERLPNAEIAISNITRLLEHTQEAELKAYLENILADWKRRQSGMQSKLQAAQLQLDRIVRAEASFSESSQGYFKRFFQQRGLYLTQAILVIAIILLLSRLSRTWILHKLPGHRQKHRSFRIRLLDLLHRMITFMLCVAGPMVVFYIAEDWVLFSLGILLLLATGWTLRTAVPRYWHQIKLFLNIGSVREGERIYMEGLPWLVTQINFFTWLENPKAGIRQRIAIDDLVERKSRPVADDEPWFPCIMGDWVMLGDDVRGKVTGISHELVELLERGGARRTYLLQEFLGLSPCNLSTNFRIKETVSISYNLQSQSTSSIVSKLLEYLSDRFKAEGYADNLLNLEVEFQSAAASSLDLVVIADFNGEMGELYNHLRRKIQGWSVDACTEYEWEIPFPQLVVTTPQG